MPELRRPDGVEIHYELRGEGPLVALAPYWSWTPGVHDELCRDLALDHRVLTYHLRGTGESGRHGPYGMESDTGDLEALLEMVGGPAVGFALADSSHRVVRLASRRPDLVAEAACLGPPLSRAEFGGSEGLVGSDSVIGAFGEMLSRDYRGAIRMVMTSTNPQLDQAGVQQRVAAHVAFCPREAAQGRTAAWTEDDVSSEAKQVGGRLTVVNARTGTATVWFPEPAELERLTRELLPEARIVEVDDGPISRPDQMATVLREISARI